MNYSTLADIDTYAIASGDYPFVECDSTGVTAAINNVGGYTSAATSIAIDTISTASFIERFSILQIGTEYLLVTLAPVYTTTTACTCTVSRGQFGTTAASMLDNAAIVVRDNRKVRCQNIATDEIVRATGFIYIDDLFGSDSDYMIEAEKVQTIYINLHLEERETAGRISEISQSSYNDGVLSIGAAGQIGLCKKAAQLVNFYLAKFYGMQRNSFKRA